MDRRSILKSLAAAPLAAVLGRPELTRAAASTLNVVATRTAQGADVKAAVAVPADPPRAAVLLVHEWWGLNNQIKVVATGLARQGYLALAADLFDGKVTTDRGTARLLTQSIDPDAALQTLVAWVQWLRAQPGIKRVATLGWCFGGSWSLTVSTAVKVDATVVYYGKVDKDPEQLAALNGPVLGHFASQDAWITRGMVSRFEAAMNRSGKAHTSYWYEADHAFANPTTARYDAGAAELAWSRTLEFLGKHLG